MKSIFPFLLFLFASTFSIAQNQCDSTENSVELELLKVRNNVVYLQTKEDFSVVKSGTKMFLSKYYEKEDEMKLNGWVSVARTSFISVKNGVVKL